MNHAYICVISSAPLFVFNAWICPIYSYLAAKSEADHYLRELKREQDEIIAVPDTGSTSPLHTLCVCLCVCFVFFLTLCLPFSLNIKPLRLDLEPIFYFILFFWFRVSFNHVHYIYIRGLKHDTGMIPCVFVYFFQVVSSGNLRFCKNFKFGVFFF